LMKSAARRIVSSVIPTKARNEAVLRLMVGV
jgi:hypothetical protein